MWGKLVVKLHFHFTFPTSNRLIAEDREAFVDQYQTEPFVQYGAVMKEYVTVPDELLEDTEMLMGYLEKSLAYIKTLKPKPTKKK